MTDRDPGDEQPEHHDPDDAADQRIVDALIARSRPPANTARRLGRTGDEQPETIWTGAAVPCPALESLDLDAPPPTLTVEQCREIIEDTTRRNRYGQRTPVRRRGLR